MEDPEWRNFKDDITFMVKAEDKAKSKPSDFIKVPFKEALNLVGSRAVYVRAGIAYVPLTKLTTIAQAHFRARLAAELSKASKFLPQIMKD